MRKCARCGSKSDTARCYYCGKNVCMDCRTDNMESCRRCRGRQWNWGSIHREKIAMWLFGLVILYAVFPPLFLPGFHDPAPAGGIPACNSFVCIPEHDGMERLSGLFPRCTAAVCILQDGTTSYIGPPAEFASPFLSGLDREFYSISSEVAAAAVLLYVLYLAAKRLCPPGLRDSFGGWRLFGGGYYAGGDPEIR